MLLLSTLLALGALPDTPPNVVVLLVDDLGWTDLGYSGSSFHETPNIDRLASRSIRFTDAYSACTVCSPTRAAILTGRYPARLRVTDWIHGHRRPRAKLRIPDWTHYLAHEEVTIAEALGAKGYASASIGKWHLGDEPHWPESQGFDRNVAGTHRGQPPSYFAPYRIPTLEDGPEGECITDRLTSEAIRFVEENRERPFFLYLPYYTVHTPIQPKEELARKYAEKAARLRPPAGAQRNPGYAAMIETLDRNVGRLLERLEELELDERTVVVFTSDNGGLVLGHSRWGQVTSNAPLRAGKGSSYEGGVRVPLLVRWPGVTRPGSVSSVPVISADFFPTVLEIAGAAPPAGREIDGESLAPLLRGGESLDRDAVFWHYPHYHPGGATPYGAVRAGDWKLIEHYEDPRVELYDLREDLGETRDLSASHPEKARELRERLHAWRESVKAQMPSPNPDHDPERAGARE